MDALAAFGSLVVTEGNNAAALVAAQTPAPAREEVPPMYNTEELQVVDAVFTKSAPDPNVSLAQTLLVVTASACALKGVVLDEKKEEEEEEKPDPRTVLADQQPRE
jgi:hypothetical protein